MNIFIKFVKRNTILLFVIGLIFFSWSFFYINKSSNANVINKENAKIILPVLSEISISGRLAFDTNCASCHGENGTGTQKGPPFINDIYNPGHHSDATFFSAVKHGVGQHHWPYGNMPPQPQVTDQEIEQIVRYIRELQEANGIVYHKHQM